MNQPPYPHYPPPPGYPPPGYPHPGYPSQQQVTATDLEHLKLLSIGYYVMAGFTLLFSFLPLIYVAMGVFMLFGSTHLTGGAPDAAGWIIIALGTAGSLVIMALALMNFLTARFIAARERRIFCMVIAALSCLHAPLGLLIGVFTLVVLSRDGVRALFSS